jgi:hypothetical protein
MAAESSQHPIQQVGLLEDKRVLHARPCLRLEDRLCGLDGGD